MIADQFSGACGRRTRLRWEIRHATTSPAKPPSNEVGTMATARSCDKDKGMALAHQMATNRVRSVVAALTRAHARTVRVWLARAPAAVVMAIKPDTP